MVGADLGVRDLVVVAAPDGREVERIVAPRPLEAAQATLRRLHRKAARQVGPWDSESQTRREPSTGWRKTQTQIAKTHHRVANVRETHLHRVTKRLATRHDVIGIETLAVKKMMAKGPAWQRKLHRGIADASFAEIARQLGYKTTWYGSTLTLAPPSFASSRICSTCGTARTKLALQQRTFWCDHYGTRLDRDLNAATNLAHHAQRAHVTPTTAAGTPAAVTIGAGPALAGEPDPVAGFVTGRATHKTPPGAAGDETGTPSNHQLVDAGSVPS